MADVTSILNAVERGDANESNDMAVTNALVAFINAFEAQCVKQIPDADALVAACKESRVNFVN